ncbi:spore coat protein [Moorellaceae bacterium AZ2]
MPIPGMDDKAMASDCLAGQKFLASSYNHAIMECANDSLLRDFFSVYQDEQNYLKMVFNAMQTHGWYTLQMANVQDINQVQQQLRQETLKLQSQIGMSPGQGVYPGQGISPGQVGPGGFQPRY